MDNESFSENEYSTLQLVLRFGHICAILIPPFLHFHFSRHKPRSLPLQEAVKKIRIAFQELGGTFIKLGQMLSARPDIVGPELSDELRNLLDKQPSMSFKLIKNIIETELKTPLARLFKSFNTVPLSTASIGQVHKAVLSTGETVVVKVRRVGLLKQVEKDLQLFKKLTVILDLLVGNKGLRFEYIYKEFAEWIMSELDFRTEGRRADTFKHNMKNIHYITVPQTYWQYTTSKVITSSFISGMTLNAIFDEMRRQKALSINEVKLPFSIDGMIVAQHIISGLFKQMFVDKFFHADLHPANFIVQKDNKIAFIDFGIIGILDTVEHTKMLLLLISLIENDPQALIKVMISFSAESFTKEQKKILYQQFARELHKIHGGVVGTVSLSHFITSLLSLSKKYSITWSSGLILVAKTISQIDSIAFQFGLKISAIELIRPQLESQITQCFSKKVTKEMIFRETLELIESGKNLPESITELEELIGDDLKLQVDGRFINQRALSPLDTILILVVSIVGTYFLMQVSPIAESQYRNILMVGFPLLLYFMIGRIIRS